MILKIFIKLAQQRTCHDELGVDDHKTGIFKKKNQKTQVCQFYPTPRCITAKDTRSACMFLQVSGITAPTCFMTLNKSLSDQRSDKAPISGIYL